jgi:hypothetical protein
LSDPVDQLFDRVKARIIASINFLVRAMAAT